MSTSAHRIRRLRWNARATSAADAFALRGLLRERGDEIAAALERALGEVPVGGDVVRLGRLELRLEATSLDALSADFGRAIEDAARASVRLALRDATRSSSSTNPSVEARRQRPAAARRDSLRHYLRTGALDWTLAGLAIEDATQALRGAAEEVVGRGALAALLDGLETPAHRIGAVLRWWRLLPAARRRAWMDSAAPLDSSARVMAALAALRQNLDVDMTPSNAPLLALWLAWPTQQDASTAHLWRRSAVEWLVSHEPLPAAVRPLVHALREEIAAHATPVAPDARPVVPPASEPEAADTAMLVPLAGMVLLHPYLPRLLAACGLVDTATSRTLSPAAMPRACALLHWLATGRDDIAEYELPLIKLLLGGAPDAPLDLAPTAPSEADRAESSALLATVPTHWTGLRGTGTDGLRLSFLQRRGLLARSDGGWTLRMQPEAFDLLLSTLPWAIGLIRLPWMPQALRVEWEGT
ncbi:MAG: contractile injection system tape measure protein [Pseudomonadota bacterium]